MKRTIVSAALAALLLPVLSSAQAPTSAADKVAKVPVIPRSALFGNPEKAQARLSPDGKFVSFIAPKDGVLNVWVGPRSDPSAAKPVTNDTKRGIRQHFWAYDNKHVLYQQDEGGDENWHIYATDVVTGAGVLAKPDASNVIEWLRASLALPVGYNRVVTIGGRGFIDGGVAMPVPFDEPLESPCEGPTVVVLTRKMTTLKAAPKLWEKAFIWAIVPRAARASSKGSACSSVMIAR